MSIRTSTLPLQKRLATELNERFKRSAIARAQDLLNQKRLEVFEELGHYQQWRELGAAVRSHVLENLDYYLQQFTVQAEKAGATVHFALTAKDAAERALEICQGQKAAKAVKSKSMVTEEVGLNATLEAAGIQVVETDLGEYLLQIDDYDKPSHIVVPALHKNRDRIRRLLAEKKGYDGDNQPENMTRFVRGLIRRDFMEADIGITGCNFGVAESGTVTLVTNEGNGRFVTTVPQTQIVFMGLERLVPTFVELDIVLSLLARSAVGSKITTYVTLITGPRSRQDRDGPAQLHIIVVDNGRSKVLGSPFREVLRCIRCGTCMLECPAYRHISGHGYGSLYPGPLGLALVPVMAGYEQFKEIVQICSLCSACNDVCPVRVPLYESIRLHRRIIAEEKRLVSRTESLLMGGYGEVIGNRVLYNGLTKLAPCVNSAPRIGPLGQWHGSRELPRVAARRFRDWYRQHRSGK